MQRHGSRLEGWTNAASRRLLKTSHVAVNYSQKTPACIFEASLMITEELFRHVREDYFLYIARARFTHHIGSGQRRGYFDVSSGNVD